MQSFSEKNIKIFSFILLMNLDPVHVSFFNSKQ